MRRGRRAKTVGLILGLGLLAHGVGAMPPGPIVETLIETDETVLGQTFAYPGGRARITAERITVPPGALLPPHLHPVPLFGDGVPDSEPAPLR